MRRGRRPTVLGALAALTVLVAGLRPAVAQNLTAADARKITAAVVQEANARGVNATVAVVDRVGNVLGVFRMGAERAVTVTSKRGIANGNGLEQVQVTFANVLGLATSPSTRLVAITKAV